MFALEGSLHCFLEVTPLNLQLVNIDMYRLDVVGVHKYSICTWCDDLLALIADLRKQSLSMPSA